MLFSILLVASSCSESMFDDDDINDDIALLSQTLSSNFGKIGISDAANGGNVDEFYFLAPTIGKDPKFNGKFNPNLSPIVEISDDFEFKTVVQSFKRDGTGGDKVSLNAAEENYTAVWDTSKSKAVKGKIYRVRVRIGEKVLGFVDVAIVNKETKKLDNGIVPLVENQSFRVVYRLEDKTCPARIEVTPKEATILVDGEQKFEAKVYNFYGELLENLKVEWFVSEDDVASVDQNGLAKGKKFGLTKVSAKSFDVTGSADLFVQESVAPRPGRDVVVFNDINVFDDIAMTRTGNIQLVKNLLNYETTGVRVQGNKIWFDCGRGAQSQFTPCVGGVDRYTFQPFRSLINSEGFEIENINSTSGTLVNIPADVKILFLFIPRVQFTLAEINEMKKFGEEGGRIIFVGEWDGFYTNVGLAVENQFLINMGAFMRNVGNAVDGADTVLPLSSLRPHPIMRNINSLMVNFASVIELGPNDFALFYNSTNSLVLAGVAQIDTTPITELKSARLDFNNSRSRVSQDDILPHKN
ncbi:Ig-like domain-containing protein [Cognataquiflexum rubidum]|uniref:Ig-like domain-containing protein n=1 Tax=Cognataquiflexum rubidum TaxID=2922273 RepID=UPI001F137C33|nr:Ig-like domain-containing protein [Cognataquiflexum rubidum]MCH6236800.1 Ig-like domain-containing protein [Cognataquiflexum rubidum]